MRIMAPLSPIRNCEELVNNFHMLIKHAFLAPIWTKLGPSYVVLRGGSYGDIPGAQLSTKTKKSKLIKKYRKNEDIGNQIQSNKKQK